MPPSVMPVSVAQKPYGCFIGSLLPPVVVSSLTSCEGLAKIPAEKNGPPMGRQAVTAGAVHAAQATGFFTRADRSAPVRQSQISQRDRLRSFRRFQLRAEKLPNPEGAAGPTDPVLPGPSRTNTARPIHGRPVSSERRARVTVLPRSTHDGLSLNTAATLPDLVLRDLLGSASGAP